MLGQHIAQRLAGHQLHRHPGGCVVLPEVVDPGDIGMLDEGHRARFLAEAGAGLRVLGVFGAQGANRDRAAVFEIARLVDDRHPAGAQRAIRIDLIVIGHDDRASGCGAWVDVRCWFGRCGHGIGPSRCVVVRYRGIL